MVPGEILEDRRISNKDKAHTGSNPTMTAMAMIPVKQKSNAQQQMNQHYQNQKK